MSGQKRNRYAVDLETTTDPEDCRVWAFSRVNIDKWDDITWGNSLKGLMGLMKNNPGNTYYFHNLKFDGDFVILYLFENGYQWVKNNRNMKVKTFTTVISDMGQWYIIEICDDIKKPHTKIYDSLKIIPMGVEQIAKTYGLEMQKLSIDYDTYREPGYVLTQEEIDYVCVDSGIVARALKFNFDHGLTKITQGSNALADYKSMTPNFKKWFPKLSYEIDKDVRKAYKGGVSYVKPEHVLKDLQEGLVFRC